MTSCRVLPKSIGVCLSLVIVFTLASTLFDDPLHAITISIGEPYRGSLVNGVKFPSNLHGFKVGDEDRSYTTPEVVGALMDAFDRFERRYPDSCDVCMGDFSRRGGGRLKSHKSHQNGRDVDIGLFAKGNAQLDCFVPMNSEILDVSKTWYMIRSLLDTQLVQNIFLDRSIQKPLYRYALGEGVDLEYLAKVFSDAGGGSGEEGIIQHVPGHRNHMHVRFSAPWSTMAGNTREMSPQSRMTIEAAQSGCLSRKVDYYAKDSDKGNQRKDINEASPVLLSHEAGSGGQPAHVDIGSAYQRLRKNYSAHLDWRAF